MKNEQVERRVSLLRERQQPYFIWIARCRLWQRQQSIQVTYKLKDKQINKVYVCMFLHVHDSLCLITKLSKTATGMAVCSHVNVATVTV